MSVGAGLLLGSVSTQRHFIMDVFNASLQSGLKHASVAIIRRKLS